MSQPAGSATVNATWLAKGLKAGFYVTESGAFTFDNTSTSSAASGGSWNTDAANTDPSSPHADVIVIPGNTGSSGRGPIHVGSANTSFLPAFGDNFTVVFDFQPATGGVGYDPGSFFSSGSNGTGGIFLQAISVDDSNKAARLEVKDAAYGSVRSATINLAAGTNKRLAFRYSRGNPVAVFVDGEATAPTSAVNDFYGATVNPSSTRNFYDVAGYSIIPSGSHVWIFDNALSDADIAALASDPWQVYGAGGGTDATAPGATVTGTGTVAAGTASGGSGATGTFTFDACENNTHSGILNNVAVNWTWLGGTVGSITSITNGSGTMTTAGMTISGLPTGAGCGIIRSADGTVVAYQEGTVA